MGDPTRPFPDGSARIVHHATIRGGATWELQIWSYERCAPGRSVSTPRVRLQLLDAATGRGASVDLHPKLLQDALPELEAVAAAMLRATRRTG